MVSSRIMVKWTLQAEQDLDELREYIAQNFNVDTAIEIADELITNVEEMLINNPLCGQIVESNPLFSKVVYKKNSIYYCENPKDKILYIVYLQARKMDLKQKRIHITL